MSIALIETMLRDAIGLDPESIGRAGIERAMVERQRHCGLDNPGRYWEYLTSSPVEQQSLIDAVIVPETWFFRDREAFIALAQLVLERLRQDRPDKLRLLSVPCASGEEAYSMAMTLLDAGVAPDRFTIDALDVSLQQIERARAGVYGKGSFRGDNSGSRERHFQPVDGRFRIGEAARNQVQFHHRNLLARDLALPSRSYDVIWCRNLLIYFDRPTQDAAIGILGPLLAPNGLFFIGSSESGVIPHDTFESVRLPMAFAFRKRADPVVPRPAADAASASRPGAHVRRPRPKPERLMLASPPPPLRRVEIAPAPATPTANPAAELKEARELADAGRFEEAAERCDSVLRRHGPSPEALYLQALVREARGQERLAEEGYRKVLYLDPRHVEALTHLWLMVDRQGRASDAQMLRERLRRLERQS